MMEYEIHTTRGVDGKPPDIWLTVGADIVRPIIFHLTIAEAFELSKRLLVEAAEAAKYGPIPGENQTKPGTKSV